MNAHDESYTAALDYLFVRTTGVWRFGLERTAALLDALGNPHRALRVIHVGGTNGKGSVCATMERVLRDRGLRVGMYTSPHLVDFRERVSVNGAPANARAIAEFVAQWTPTIERIGATFFEATTAMAFALLAQESVDVAIIEVGLGGRLDATNVVDPMLAVVTNVGIDHTEYLGDTRTEIAREKAGIFKAQRPAIIGERDHEIRDALRGHAIAAHASPVHAVFDNARVNDVRVSAAGTRMFIEEAGVSHSVHTGLVGAHQADNTLVALRALEQLPAPYAVGRGAALRSLPDVRVPGRFDQRGKVIFDVAHNRDGARVCAATLGAVAPASPVACVLSVLRDKDWLGMMEELAAVVDVFVLTLAPTSPAHRAWDPRVAADAARQRGWNARIVQDFDEALHVADAEGQTVLVTGSFHTVGDAMVTLHVSPHGD